MGGSDLINSLPVGSKLSLLLYLLLIFDGVHGILKVNIDWSRWQLILKRCHSFRIYSNLIILSEWMNDLTDFLGQLLRLGDHYLLFICQRWWSHLVTFYFHSSSKHLIFTVGNTLRGLLRLIMMIILKGNWRWDHSHVLRLVWQVTNVSATEGVDN
jgi:hypothetical protein